MNNMKKLIINRLCIYSCSYYINYIFDFDKYKKIIINSINNKNKK